MKIFQCDMFTTNESVIKGCEGGLYQECLLCTLNLHPEKKVVKKKKRQILCVSSESENTKIYSFTYLDGMRKNDGKTG